MGKMCADCLLYNQSICSLHNIPIYQVEMVDCGFVNEHCDGNQRSDWWYHLEIYSHMADNYIKHPNMLKRHLSAIKNVRDYPGMRLAVAAAANRHIKQVSKLLTKRT